MAIRTYFYSLLIVTTSVSAQTDSSLYREDESPWMLGISMGLLVWPTLGEIESTDGGSFNTGGLILDASVHRKTGEWLAADVYLGGEMGLFLVGSNIQGQFENLEQSGIYLMPSAKLHFRNHPKWSPFIEAGFGWYELETVEYLCSGLCYESRTYFSSEAFGGYVGGRVGRRYFASFRVHFLDFGGVSGIDTISGEMDGPLYTLAGGFAF